MKLGNQNAIVNGKVTQIDPENAAVRPITKDSRTLLPVRFIAESLGAEVDWDASTQTVVLELENDIIKLVIGSDKMDVNGEEIELDVQAQTINSRTMLPLRSLVEAIGKEVFWDDLGLIIISDEEQILDNKEDEDFIKDIDSYFTNYASSEYTKTTEREEREKRLEQELKMQIIFLMCKMQILKREWWG